MKIDTDVADPPSFTSEGLSRHINIEGLSTFQLTSLNRLIDEEICPCGCPSTYMQCLASGGCRPGQLLAEWMVKQLRKNAPEQYLYPAVSREINKGYLASPHEIDTLNAHHKGSDRALITIVEFADFECPACKLAAAEIKSFVEDHSSEVKLYFMHFPLSVHQNAEIAAIAAEAAGQQGKFWEMHDLLFAHQAPLTREVITALARKIFVEKQLARFEADQKDEALIKKVNSHKNYGGNVLRLEGTPSFLFNGRPYHLTTSKEGYELRLAMEKLRNEIDCRGHGR